MGKPSTSGIELANQTLTGSFAAVGVSASLPVFGGFNIAVWTQVNTTLTTTASSSTATVGSATGLAIGYPINSVNVPAGTVIGNLVSTTVTLAFPPGVTNASVITGADSAALFIGGTYVASVQLERSFDGGSTYMICGVGGGGQQAIYLNSGIVSVVASEPERGVLYRLNCTAYTSGAIQYRISTTGFAALSFGLMS